MAETWHHQHLGEFEQDGVDEWVISLPIPGFDVFADPPHRLCIIAPHQQAPTDAQAAAATELLVNGSVLGRAIPEALWADIRGQGLGSKHWWYGNLEELNDNLMPELGDEPIETLEGLIESLTLESVVIGSQHETAVEVCFSCDWEDEHGVSALIKADRVIGLGYTYDLEAFPGEPWQPRDRPKPNINPFTGEHS